MKAFERRCPHCGDALPTDWSTVGATATALLLGLSLSSCGDSKTPEPASVHGGSKTPEPADIYGAPPSDDDDDDDKKGDTGPAKQPDAKQPDAKKPDAKKSEPVPP